MGDAFGTVVVHAAGLLHWPLLEQVCTPLPEHCVAPGVHTPEHAPLTHTYVQATGLPQVPPLEHVCTPLPEHWVAPGVQEPAHVPELQV